jgi:predicted ArsR family transcriptional regulator
MNSTISYQALSAHILRHAAAAQVAGTKSAPVLVELLAADLRVRRVDVRRSLSALHKQGLLDVAQMRLTLAGFALGKALEGRRLRAIRIPPARESRAA